MLPYFSGFALYDGRSSLMKLTLIIVLGPLESLYLCFAVKFLAKFGYWRTSNLPLRAGCCSLLSWGHSHVVNFTILLHNLAELLAFVGKVDLWVHWALYFPLLCENKIWKNLTLFTNSRKKIDDRGNGPNVDLESQCFWIGRMKSSTWSILALKKI